MRPELLAPSDGHNARTTGFALSLAGAPCPDFLVGEWSPLELAVAYDWAMREHLNASDILVRRRPKPWFVGVAEVPAEPAAPANGNGLTSEQEEAFRRCENGGNSL